MLFAVIDLGSNSFKMTVAEWSPNRTKNPFSILHKERHPIQLGASVFEKGRISPKDYRAGMRALSKMRTRLRDFSSPLLRVVATSAIRDSSNGRAFVEEAKRKLALPIEIISGPEEARLIAEGLKLEFPRVSRGLLVDIGGGSTEIASFGPGWPHQVCTSHKMGSVRLAMQFFKKPRSVDLEKVRKHVRSYLLKGHRPGSVERLIGSAGTIQSLGDILSTSDTQKIIQVTALNRWIENNVHSTPKELMRDFGLTASRARVIIPGAIILSEVMRWLGRTEIRVTQMSLRDGVLVDLLAQWRSSPILSPVLSNTRFVKDRGERGFATLLEQTADRFRSDLTHVRHVAFLACSIFDQLKASGITLSLEERRYLLTASYLHDIGKIISENGHHKHSAYLIQNLRFHGLSSLDMKKAALIAFYHRKIAPPKKDPLPGGVRGIHATQVRRLTAILRLADGLDGAHSQKISDLRIRLSKKQALLELSIPSAQPINMTSIRDKAAYFEEYFGVRLVSFITTRLRAKSSRAKPTRVSRSKT